jgi:predicted nucleotidyltransferase
MFFNGRVPVGELLDRRRAETTARINRLRQRLTDAERLCGERACVYATGSFSRGEASEHSDLDVFIAGKGTQKEPALTGLDEILIKADLIEAIRELGIPDFSGDGEYLTHYTVGELVDTLGKPEDDASNTFTARLLLLLESYPLLGESAYRDITKQVITAYWRDYQDHKKNFIPAYLTNDILRMWRTFCVNYEARTQSDPPERKAKRKLKNLKLKHSRLLTCYSALLYLLAVFSKNDTVSPSDAVSMIELTPSQRLEWLISQPELVDAHNEIAELVKCYEDFLRLTDASEKELVERFLDKEQSKKYFDSANRFGDLMFEVLEAIGKKKENRFYRLLIV